MEWWTHINMYECILKFSIDINQKKQIKKFSQVSSIVILHSKLRLCAQNSVSIYHVSGRQILGNCKSLMLTNHTHIHTYIYTCVPMSAKVTECARNARLETDYRADSWKCVPGYARGWSGARNRVSLWCYHGAHAPCCWCVALLCFCSVLQCVVVCFNLL